LIFIAGQLKKASKSIIRYGGDEFIIIFPSSITKNDAINKLNGIREEILKKNLIIKDSSFKTSFSFGVCEYKKDDAFTDVIDKADNDMYQDKIEIKKRVTGI
jgi:diguanylate cyclase (GGDEF)-like protein